MLLHVLFYLIGVIVICISLLAVLHCWVWRTGQLVTKKFPNGMEATVVSGDRLNTVVYKEMFVDKAYFTNGVNMPAADEVPLIIDIGANVLSSVSMMRPRLREDLDSG